MPPKLPQSYKFKYFSSRNLVVGGPLLIFDLNVTSSSHGFQGSSPLLFSPCNYDLSNVDHDDDVMSLDEFNPTLETNLLVVPSKLIINKKNYDASKKDVKGKMCNEVEGKDKIFVAKWDSLYKHVGKRKAKKNFITNLPSFMGSYKNCMNFVLWLI
jgi:hypothetical protein